MYTETFAQTYRYSKPKAIRDMMDLGPTRGPSGEQIPGITHRTNRAYELMARGYLIDVECDVAYAGDALTTMILRKNHGFEWIYSAGRIPLPGSVDIVTGKPLYTGPVPEGGIKVSTDPADYPLHPDLIVNAKPFGWSMHAFGRDGSGEYLGVGSTYSAIDKSDVGAKYTERNGPTEIKEYRKTSTPGQGGEPIILWERTK